MLRYNRVLWKSGVSTLYDLSKSLNYYLAGQETIDFAAATDALYIGSDAPFNHRWFDIVTVNDQASELNVAIWDGGDWVDCVDVIDETITSATKSMGQSGFVSWTPNIRESSWACQSSTEDMGPNEILSTVKIYDLYWAKLTFSADLKDTFALKYLGHKFCGDTDLYAEYPDLNNSTLLTAFAAAKTTWNDQEFLATKYVLDDLKDKKIIWSKNQIMDWGLLKPPTIHKTASIIYSAFGDDYRDNMAEAEKKYARCMQKKSWSIDLNANAYLENSEKKSQTDWMTR